MAHFKKPKLAVKPRDMEIATGGSPNNREISCGEPPESFYQKHPSWNFHSCDTGQWVFTKETAGDEFWKDILPKLQGWETMTWQ